MATQKQRSQSTRSRLLKAFRAAFLKRGYDAATTQDVLAEIGLSKGALYHHFRSKSEIIEAIYEDESRRVIERALRSVEDVASPLEKLKGACLAWTKEVRAPGVSKVLFEIGPSALGLEKSKKIEEAFSRKHIQRLLDAAVAAKEIEVVDSKLLTALLNALVGEAALYARRTGRDSTSVLRGTLNAVFSSLKPRPD